MPKGITALNLFQSFSTQLEYEKITGKLAPEWNPSRRPKNWFDPEAINATEDMVVYDKCFIGFDSNSNPKWRKLFLTPIEASTVNIPIKGNELSTTNIPGADQPSVPMPLRELADNEVLKPGFGNLPLLYTADEVAGIEVGFTQTDHDLLVKIAAKLGV